MTNTSRKRVILVGVGYELHILVSDKVLRSNITPVYFGRIEERRALVRRRWQSTYEDVFQTA